MFTNNGVKGLGALVDRWERTEVVAGNMTRPSLLKTYDVDFTERRDRSLVMMMNTAMSAMLKK